MAADTAYLFDEYAHVNFAIPALTVGIFIIISLPLAGLCFFKPLLRAFGNEKSLILESLVIGLKSSKKVWDIVRIISILSLKCLDVLFTEDTFLRSLYLYLLLEIYLFSVSKNQPYVLNSIERFEKQSLKISQITILLS